MSREESLGAPTEQASTQTNESLLPQAWAHHPPPVKHKPSTANTPAAVTPRHQFYVSNQGNDNNPGTIAAPWKTIDRVNKEHIAPGDSVFFHARQTFTGNLVIEGHGADDAPVQTLVSTYGGSGRAKIEAHEGLAVLAKNRGHISIRNLDLYGDKPTNKGFGIEVVNETKTRLDNVRITNVQSHGFKWVGVYVGGTPPLPGEPAPEHKPERYGFNDVEIKHSIAHDNTYFGIFVSGPWVWQFPAKIDPTKQIWEQAAPSSFGYANTNVRVIDCRAYNNPGDPNFKENHSGNGILVDDTDIADIEFNRAWHNGAENGSQSGGPVGIWANQANRVTMRFNRSWDNRTGGLADGAGFDLDGGVTNSLMEYNYSEGNDGAGFLVWSYWGTLRELKGNVIRNNISVNDGRKWQFGGIHIGNSGSEVENIDVYNNVVFMTKNGTRPTVGTPRDFWVGGGNPNLNIRSWHNTFISGKGVPLVEVEPRSTTSFHGNKYQSAPGDFKIIYDGKTYHSLDEWRKATKQETKNHP